MKRHNFLQTHTVKMRLSGKKFRNPYFSKNNSGSARFLRFIFFILAILAFISIIYAFLSLSIFHIRNIEIEGEITMDGQSIESIVESSIEGTHFRLLPKKHIFFIPKKTVINAISTIPEIQNVELERNGRTLIIRVQEKIQSAIWVSDSHQYFIDNAGKIVRELTLDEMFDVQERVYANATETFFIQSPVYLIFDASQTMVSQQEEVLNAKSLETFTQIFWRISEFAIEPESFIIGNPGQTWATLKIKHGFDILISGEGDAEKQLKNIKVVLDEYKQEARNLQYIDVRFGERVFVK